MSDANELAGATESRITRPDVVGIIESIYRLEQDAPSWIAGILERLRPWVDDDGLGLFGFVYSVSRTGELVPGPYAAVGCPQEVLDVLPLAPAQQEPDYIRKTYQSVDACAASEFAGWRQSGGAAYGRPIGILDNWGINGRNPGDRGCVLLINRRQEGAPPPAQKAVFVRIAAHLAAAQRLRERLGLADAVERAEAVIAPDGSVHHATGDATAARSLDALRTSARAIERARGKLRRDDPDRALDMWQGLVAARWTLVDHFESDGRRYVLAQENEAARSSTDLLSSRERQVLANAALGRTNKEIAYVLGIAHSTVRVLLTRAAKKLGAHTRQEVVARFEALTAGTNTV